jgi:uncharacterized phiE125 gp8 family phage protein
MGLTLVTGPAEEPVSLEEMRLHLRVDDLGEEVTHVAELIRSAREYVEEWVGCQMVTAVWKLTLNHFHDPRHAYKDCETGWTIRVPKWPLQAVSAVTYLDVQGATQTLATASYLVDSVRRPGRLFPAYGLEWPETYDVPNAVSITFTAGFGAADAVPRLLRQVVKLLAAHDYENREPAPAEMERVKEMLRLSDTGIYV